MKLKIRVLLAVLFLSISINNVHSLSETEAGVVGLGGGALGGAFWGYGVASLAQHKYGEDKSGFVFFGVLIGGVLGYYLAHEATPKRRMARGICLKEGARSCSSLNRYSLFAPSAIEARDFLTFVGINRVGSRWPLLDEERELALNKRDLLCGRGLLEAACREDVTLENNCRMHIGEIDYLIEKINFMIVVITTSPQYQQQLDRLQQYEIEKKKLDEERRKNWEKERAKEKELKLARERNDLKKQELGQSRHSSTQIFNFGQNLPVVALPQAISVREIRVNVSIFAKEILREFEGSNFFDASNKEDVVKKENIIKNVEDQIAQRVAQLIQNGQICYTQYQGVELRKKVKELILEYLHKLKFYPNEECSVCLEKFNNRKIRRIYLPCGHDICKNCLRRLDQLKCPLCRKNISVDLSPIPPAVYVTNCPGMNQQGPEPSAPPVLEDYSDMPNGVAVGYAGSVTR